MPFRRRPPGPLRPQGQAGMGNPYEEAYFYSGFRDFGSGTPDVGQTADLIYDPSADPTTAPPDVKRAQDEFWSRAKEELKDLPIFTKDPAFVQPPFFSRPKIKLRRMTIVAGGAAAPDTTVLDWEVGGRQYWVCTSIGMDTDNPVLASNGLTVARFTVNNVIEQLWDDQTIAIPDPPGPPAAGETTQVTGSVAVPFNLREAGLVFGVPGHARVRFQIRNHNPVLPANDLIVTAQMTFYEYWMPNSSEFEKGQWQT